MFARATYGRTDSVLPTKDNIVAALRALAAILPPEPHPVWMLGARPLPRGTDDMPLPANADDGCPKHEGSTNT